jgi:hypothetical protein
MPISYLPCQLDVAAASSAVVVIFVILFLFSHKGRQWSGGRTKGREEMTSTTMTATKKNFVRRPGTLADDILESIWWALCQVASRMIAGQDAHHSLCLIPVMDMTNHDVCGKVHRIDWHGEAQGRLLCTTLLCQPRCDRQ